MTATSFGHTRTVFEKIPFLPGACMSNMFVKRRMYVCHSHELLDRFFKLTTVIINKGEYLNI